MDLSTGLGEIFAAILSIAAGGAGTVMWFLFQSVRQEARTATKEVGELKDEYKEELSNLKDEQKQEVSRLKDEHSAYKLYVAEHYVTQQDLTKAVTSLERSIERLIEAVNQNAKEVRDGFSEIHKRIDQKADK
jgi:uncharacterized protein YukE